MSELPSAFHDFAEEDFPFTITIWGHDEERLWEVTVEGPCAIQVPAFPGQVGRITVVDGKGSLLAERVNDDE